MSCCDATSSSSAGATEERRVCGSAIVLVRLKDKPTKDEMPIRMALTDITGRFNNETLRRHG